MGTKDDRAKTFRDWEVRVHRRILRNLWRIADGQAARAAAGVARRRRRREPPSPDLDLLEDFKRTIMPVVADLAELAGADKKPFLELAKPRSTRRKGSAAGG